MKRLASVCIISFILSTTLYTDTLLPPEATLPEKWECPALQTFSGITINQPLGFVALEKQDEALDTLVALDLQLANNPNEALKNELQTLCKKATRILNSYNTAHKKRQRLRMLASEMHPIIEETAQTHEEKELTQKLFITVTPFLYAAAETKKRPWALYAALAATGISVAGLIYMCAQLPSLARDRVRQFLQNEINEPTLLKVFLDLKGDEKPTDQQLEAYRTAPSLTDKIATGFLLKHMEDEAIPAFIEELKKENPKPKKLHPAIGRVAPHAISHVIPETLPFAPRIKAFLTDQTPRRPGCDEDLSRLIVHLSFPSLLPREQRLIERIVGEKPIEGETLTPEAQRALKHAIRQHVFNVEEAIPLWEFAKLFIKTPDRNLVYYSDVTATADEIIEKSETYLRSQNASIAGKAIAIPILERARSIRNHLAVQAAEAFYTKEEYETNLRYFNELSDKLGTINFIIGGS